MKKQLFWCIMCLMVGSSSAYAQQTKTGEAHNKERAPVRTTGLRVMTPDGEWIDVEHHSSARSRRDVAKSLCETQKGFQVPHLVAVSYVDEDGKEVMLDCRGPK